MNSATERKNEAQARKNPQASVWVWISIAAAVLAIGGNIAALLVPAIYAPLTPAFLTQAYAQDVANLALVAPAWLILAALTLRGSVRARLLWLGVLLFTVYNYVIYTLSVPFGPLFLLWVAVLGLSFYSLLGGVLTSDQEQAAAVLENRLPSRVTVMMLPGTGSSWRDRKIADGLFTAFRPVSVIANTPSSLTAPNRFFTARIMR